MKKLNQTSNLGSGCLLVFGLFWTGFACMFGMVPMIGGLGLFLSSEDMLGAMIALCMPSLFSIPFIVVGIVLIAIGVRPIIAGMRVSQPEVSISNDTLRVGDEFTVIYQQTFKSATDVKRIAYDFVLRETARYRRGTDTVTVTHENKVDGHEHGVRRFESGETFNDRRMFRIPREGMHTFEAPNNKLNWFLKVHVELEGWPDFQQEYEIKVIPEMAR
jgi:hypothetical protein